MEESSSASAKVNSIFIYPIKSCGGISVSEAAITGTGFRWDRQWLVVNEKGRGITQRVEPTLALVRTEITPIHAFSDPSWEPDSTSFLVISAQGMTDVLKIPLTTPPLTTEGVSVFEWSGSAFDEGEIASNWFTTFLQKPSRLVRFNEESQTRPINSDRARDYRIKFNDIYQFLLLSQGSMDALNERLDKPIPINRFRPNILIDECAPFAEDLWKEITINELTFQATEICSRCKIPNIDQETAIGASEITEALKEFRSDKVLRPDEKPRGKVFLGNYFVCEKALSQDQGKGECVKVGDLIHVLNNFSSYVDAAT